MNVWRMTVVLDKQLANPGETIQVSFTVHNPLSVSIYIHAIAWNASFYPITEAVHDQTEALIPPKESRCIASGTIRVPNVRIGEYRIDVAAHTLVYNRQAAQWVDCGSVSLNEPRRFNVVRPLPVSGPSSARRRLVLFKALNRSSASGTKAEKKRVFVSFDFDHDKVLKEFLIGQSRLPDSPFEVSDWSMKEAAPHKSWEDEADERIKRSDVVIVVLGTKTHKAPGVLKEVRMAKRNGKPIFQIIGHKDRTCRPILGAGRVYHWTWPNLKMLLGR